MKNNATAFALMLMLGLSVNSASAMSMPSSEDPEVKAVWEFFLPFLDFSSEAEKTEVQNKFVQAVENYYQDEDHDEDYDEDFDDENFDFAAEKDEIMAEINEEIAEIDDADLKASLESEAKNLNSIDDEEKFFEVLDAIYEKVDAHYGYDDEDYEDFEDEFDGIITETDWETLSGAQIDAKLVAAGKEPIGDDQDPLYNITETEIDALTDAEWEKIDAQYEEIYGGDSDMDEDYDHDCDFEDDEEEDEDDEL